MAQFIPKEEIKEKDSIIVKIFFWFALLFLIISGGLSYLIDWKLSESKQRLIEVENQISKIGTLQQVASKDKVSNYQKKLDDIAELIKNHKAPTRLFYILESNVHPGVIVSDITYLNIGKQETININGVVDDLISLAQQIMIFQKYPDIERVLLTSVNANNDQKITFKIELTLRETSLMMQ
jgi:hypothetical protein